MPVIYEAWHYKLAPGDVPDKVSEQQSAKMLGEYTGKAKAEAAIERRWQEEGFHDWPTGFRIEIVPLDQGTARASDESPARLYRVWHFRIGADDEDDRDDPAQAATQVGVFSNEQNARSAVDRLQRDPRFRDFPDGFRIGSGPPNVDYWASGFISWDDA